MTEQEPWYYVPDSNPDEEAVTLCGGPLDGGFAMVAVGASLFIGPAWVRLENGKVGVFGRALTSSPIYRRDPVNPRRFVYVQPTEQKP